jgi:hypothetical protein
MECSMLCNVPLSSTKGFGMLPLLPATISRSVSTRHGEACVENIGHPLR